MKKLLNIAVVVIFLTTGFNVNAADRIDVKIQENRTLVVELGNVEQGTFLTLEDRNGEILFKDSFINNDLYKMTLDLSTVPMGTYYLRLEKEYAILTSVIVKTEEGLKVEGDSSEVLFKPRYKVQDDLVKVFLSNPKESRTELKVYTASGELVGECKSGKNLFKKTLDFSQMPAGKYVIEILNGSRKYVKTIEIG